MIDETADLAPAATTAPLLNKPVNQALWSIAWPVIALGLLRSGYFLADAYWAAQLGTDGPAAMAALGACAFALWILYSLADLAAVGTHTKVSFDIGANNKSGPSAWGGQGIWVALFLGALLATTAQWLEPLYLGSLGFSGQEFERASQLAKEFLHVVLVTSAVLAVHCVLDSMFRGIGDTRTPMLISAGTLILNIVLDPILMFGWGPISAQGLQGAAWATAVSNLVACGLGWVQLSKSGNAPKMSTPEYEKIAYLLKIGAPQAISGVGFCLVYVILGDLLHQFGPQAMAGLGIGHRIEGLSFQIQLGFSAAAGTLVGQNLGAGRLAQAGKSAHRAALMVGFGMLPFTLMTVIAAKPIAAIWAHDDLTLQYASGYLFVAGVVAIPMALEIIYQAAFAALGKTMPSMLITLPGTLLRIPLAAYLTTIPSLGAHGVWTAIGVTTFLKGFALAVLFAWYIREKGHLWGPRPCAA